MRNVLKHQSRMCGTDACNLVTLLSCRAFLWCLLLGSPAFSMITISLNSSILTPLGENATFVCTNFESNIPTFIVEDEDGTPLALVREDDKRVLEERKIFQDEGSDEINLNVLANERNNNTIIRCRDLTSPLSFTVDLYVTVIGPPLPPAVASTLISATELILKWEEPFTWPDHNVSHYNITELVASGAPRHYNTTGLNHSYSSPDGEIMKECQNITFVVTAVSDLGPSGDSVLTTGLPIPLGMFGEIKPVVRFTKSGDPEVNATLEPPPLCIYQSAVLILKLVEESGEVLPAMRHTYTGHPQQISVFFPMHLKPNANYTLMLEVNTLAGNATASVVFDTLQPKTFSSLSGLLIPVIAAMAGALGVIFVLIIIIIICCATVCRKSKPERSARGDGTGCQRDSTYDYIEDYHVVPSARKNQYLASANPIPMHQQQPRSESPYQDMNSAKAGPSTSQTKTLGNSSSLDIQQGPNGNASLPQYPNNDMHVTPGGSVVYRSRGSANSSTDGDYAAMQSPRQRDLARCSVTLPENALPYNGQPNGEYKFTE